jgi:hypothetical protein
MSMVMMFGECCSSEVHDAVKADPVQWSACTFVGIQDGCGVGPDYEVRNHECGSTLYKPTSVAVLPDRRSAL